MDFILALPRSRTQHDSIWVILDIMKKFTHLKNTDSLEDYAMLYLQEVVRVHAIYLTIKLCTSFRS